MGMRQRLSSDRSRRINLELAFDLKVTVWEFDGHFQPIDFDETVTYPLETDDPFPISELHLFPLRYAEPEKQIAIAERGRKFWLCRSQQYVEYSGWDYEGVEYYVRLAASIHEHLSYLVVSKMLDSWWTFGHVEERTQMRIFPRKISETLSAGKR
jgi:hypothetical protein